MVIHRGRVLVGVRGAEGPLPGLAEFPGGKVEPGETPALCALRECKEECRLDVEAVRPLADYLWDYPHGCVHLHFVLCRPRAVQDVQDSHLGFRWVDDGELIQLHFPEGNRRVLEPVRQCLLDQTG